MNPVFYNGDVSGNVLSQNEKNEIKKYIDSLAKRTEEAARNLYFINQFFYLGNNKIQQWCNAAFNFLITKYEYDFIEANYGYAVEEYVNIGIAEGIPSVPIGFSVRTQVTHGHTRPDIVIKKTVVQRLPGWI